MNQKLIVSCVSVGLREHGHNISFSPFAALTIIETVKRNLGESVECYLFDMAMLGIEEVIRKLEAVHTQALMLSVPVSGYWPMGVRLCEWATNRNIRVLAGGYHFGIEGSPIPRIAAEKRKINVCYGDGHITAPAFLGHLLDPHKVKLENVPNLFFWNGTAVQKTLSSILPLELRRYPTPSLELHDPREYWKLLPKTSLHQSGKDSIDGIPIGRTLVGPEVLAGCTYRTSRLKQGRQACEYCTITSMFAGVSGECFWHRMRELYHYTLSIPWSGNQGIRVYQTNDDLGSNRAFVNKVWQTRPEWFREAMKSSAKLGQRVYAWHILSKDLAKMLHEIGVRWIYMGADGKQGFTPHHSNNHPLVRTLENCRTYGLSLHLGFVIGLQGQGWNDIYEWLKFRHWLAKNYHDVISSMNGWVHVVAPGSPGWEILAQRDQSFLNTDCGDEPDFLEKVRGSFFRNCTNLHTGGLSSEQVRSKLYELSSEFELEEGMKSNAVRSFMLDP